MVHKVHVMTHTHCEYRRPTVCLFNTAVSGRDSYNGAVQEDIFAVKTVALLPKNNNLLLLLLLTTSPLVPSLRLTTGPLPLHRGAH